MDKMKAKLTAQRMIETRAQLLKDHPFFGSLLMRLHLACAPCETACTDATRLIFDPEFATRLNEEEMQFVMLHEVLHCALHHCTRGRGLNSLLYNIACDIVTNSTILQMQGRPDFQIDGIPVMHLAPSGQEGYLYNAEQVYEQLLDKYRDFIEIEMDFSQIEGVDRHDIWSGIQDSSQVNDAWDTYITDTAKRWGNAGDLTPEIRKLVDNLKHRSQVDWRQVLHDFIQHDQFDYTFCPPDHRFSGSDFLLPAFHPDADEGRADDLWLCIDTSASVSPQELTTFLCEVEDAMGQVRLSGKISFFDSTITDPVDFATADEVKAVHPVGGGGTSFHIIFSYLEERMSAAFPRAILIFTDGYAPCPEEELALGIPVLWVITKEGKDEMPWGQIVEIR